MSVRQKFSTQEQLLLFPHTYTRSSNISKFILHYYLLEGSKDYAIWRRPVLTLADSKYHTVAHTVYTACVETSIIQHIIVLASCPSNKTLHSFSISTYYAANYIQAFTSHYPLAFYDSHLKCTSNDDILKAIQSSQHKSLAGQKSLGTELRTIINALIYELRTKVDLLECSQILIQI